MMIMKRILFQGDSITDVIRHREDDQHRGMGYPTLVTAELGFDYPGEYEFLNRGISGNRIVDLYARIKADLLNLKPDVLSILIGINDVWHEIAAQNGVATEKFEKIYNMMIEEIKAELPNIRIMVLEPFVLKGTATLEEWDRFRTGAEEKAAAAKRVAEANNLDFVPLMKKFDEVDKKTDMGYWLYDGVHPTAMGHELIAREWVKAFKK